MKTVKLNALTITKDGQPLDVMGVTEKDNWKSVVSYKLDDAFNDHNTSLEIVLPVYAEEEIKILIRSTNGYGNNNYFMVFSDIGRINYAIPPYFDSSVSYGLCVFSKLGNDSTHYSYTGTSNGYTVVNKRGAISGNIESIKRLVTAQNGAGSILGSGTEIVVFIR